MCEAQPQVNQRSTRRFFKTRNPGEEYNIRTRVPGMGLARPSSNAGLFRDLVRDYSMVRSA
jgi:hypothetical protein